MHTVTLEKHKKLISTGATNDENEEPSDDLKSEVRNLERRKEILAAEAKRLESDLKSRRLKLRSVEAEEMEARRRLGEINEKMIAGDNSNVASGDLSASELRGVETKLLSAASDVDQILAEARKLSSELEGLDLVPRVDEMAFPLTRRVLESLDIILLGNGKDQKPESPFVTCPICKRKVDARDCLSLKKKKQSILFYCSFCDAETRFSLANLFENMIRSNPVTASAAGVE